MYVVYPSEAVQYSLSIQISDMSTHINGSLRPPQNYFLQKPQKIMFRIRL